jgi:hypothetical protein
MNVPEQRLRDYKERGWLSHSDFVHYDTLLQKQNNSENYRKIVMQDLDLIAGRFRHPIKRANTEEEEDDEGKENQDIILEPIDLWHGPGRLTEDQMQEVFVEMCFFARLGFVQPPCCLRCTYRESMQKRTKHCSRWVVWRKNAATLMHPNRLAGNILIMSCHVARKLLAGQVVQGREWDARKKQITLQK